MRISPGAGAKIAELRFDETEPAALEERAQKVDAVRRADLLPNFWPETQIVRTVFAGRSLARRSAWCGPPDPAYP